MSVNVLISIIVYWSVSNKLNLRTPYKLSVLTHCLLSEMLIPDTKCKTMEKIDQEIANEYLDNLILNAINPIQKTENVLMYPRHMST